MPGKPKTIRRDFDVRAAYKAGLWPNSLTRYSVYHVIVHRLWMEAVGFPDVLEPALRQIEKYKDMGDL